METGKYYMKNQKRLNEVSYDDWRVALSKCTNLIRHRIGGKTSFGAHSKQRLGEDPVQYYLSVAYDKLISGLWEWKADRTLSEQLMRIANKFISDEVEKSKNAKKTSDVTDYYENFEDELYSLYKIDEPYEDENVEEYILLIEKTIKGKKDLEEFWECVVTGYKRREIADIMETQPKKVDKLRGRFIKEVKEFAKQTQKQ